MLLFAAMESQSYRGFRYNQPASPEEAAAKQGKKQADMLHSIVMYRKPACTRWGSHFLALVHRVIQR